MSKVGDVDEMAANAIKLLTDDALMTQFRKNAFEQAKNFDAEKIVPLYENIYEGLLQK